MFRDFETGDKVRVREWGGGVIIGSCAWQMTDATPHGKVWIVKLSESGKIYRRLKKGLKNRNRLLKQRYSPSQLPQVTSTE